MISFTQIFKAKNEWEVCRLANYWIAHKSLYGLWMKISGYLGEPRNIAVNTTVTMPTAIIN